MTSMDIQIIFANNKSEVINMPKDSQIDPKEVRKAKAKGQTSFASDKADNGNNNSKKQSGNRHKPGSDK